MGFVLAVSQNSGYHLSHTVGDLSTGVLSVPDISKNDGVILGPPGETGKLNRGWGLLIRYIRLIGGCCLFLREGGEDRLFLMNQELAIK